MTTHLWADQMSRRIVDELERLHIDTLVEIAKDHLDTKISEWGSEYLVADDDDEDICSSCDEVMPESHRDTNKCEHCEDPKPGYHKCSDCDEIFEYEDEHDKLCEDCKEKVEYKLEAS